ncbi:MAG TPA: CapA family protein [Spirochaetia bacterium]|nr:CapA family protein [Spirochaetia bacterium]
MARVIFFATALCLAFVGGAWAGPETTLRLTFVGDLMAHPALSALTDYRDIYKGVADILAQSDLTFANLEFPVDSTQPPSGYPLFNAHRGYVRAALEAGIDVFSTANNHAFDGGEEGVLQTVRALSALDDGTSRRLFFSGIRGNPARPFAPEEIVVNGVRIGFLAVTQFLNQPGGGRYVDVVDYDDGEDAASFARLVKEVSPLYDVFIVSYHGDREYVQEPSEAKRAFFHKLVENGATVVFAHHPHVLQDYELVSVHGSTRLIMYSMGNFISGMTWRNWPPDPDALGALVSDSIMLAADVTVNGAGASVSRVAPIPIADYRDGEGRVEVLKLDELADGKDGVPSAWKPYFQARLSRIAKLLGVTTDSFSSGLRTVERVR